MSAFGTKKPGANEAQDLTYPEVLADTIAGREQYGYLPRGTPMRDPLPAGRDLQSQYHEQKRLDANRMAMAKVGSTRSSTRHMLTHHNNYALPKPLLGQRVFANPSLGAGGFGGDLYSARNDLRGGGGIVGAGDDEMTGGVLRSAVGQNYGRNKLQARIAQLDAIANAKNEWLGNAPPGVASASEEGDYATSQGIEPNISATKIELVGQLQSIASAIDSHETGQVAFTDTAKMLRTLIRVAPTENKEGLEDLLEWFDSYGAKLQKEDYDRIEDADEDGPSVASTPHSMRKEVAFAEKMSRVVQSARQYVKDCIAHQFDSPKDRLTASRSAIKRLKLGSISNVKIDSDYSRLAQDEGERWWREHGDDSGTVLGPLESVSRSSSSLRRAYGPGSETSSSSSESSGGPGGRLGPRAGVFYSDSLFTEPSISREDYDHLHSASRFSRNPRLAFGERSGAFLGEAPPDPNAPPSNAPQRRLKAAELRPTAPAPVPTWGETGRNATASRSNLPIGEDEDDMSAQQYRRMGQTPFSVSSSSSHLPPPPNPRARMNEGWSSVGRSTMLPPGSETPAQILRSAPIDSRHRGNPYESLGSLPELSEIASVPHPIATRTQRNNAALHRTYGSLGRIRNPPVKFKRSTAKERAERKLNEGIRRVYHSDSEEGEGRFRGGAEDEEKGKKAMARLLDASKDLDEGDELESHGPATGLHRLLAVASKPGASKVVAKKEFAPSHSSAVAKPTSSGLPLLLANSASAYNGYARKMLMGEHISREGIARQTAKEIQMAIKHLMSHDGLSEAKAREELLKRLKMRQGGGMVGAGIWDEIKKAWNFFTNPFGTVSGALAKGITERKPQSHSERQAMESKVQKELEAENARMNSNEEGEGRRKRKGGVKSLRAKLAEPPKKGGNFGDDVLTGITTPFKVLGSLFGLGSRADLPTTREGYCELAKKMTGKGHPIRVNSGSQLKSIRANFIKKLGL